MKVVTSAKDLQVVPIGNQALSNLVDFFWLLRLTSAHAEDDIRLDLVLDLYVDGASFETNEARFFGVLEVVAVTFGNLAVDCLLDPGDLVDHLVAPLFHHLDCESVLSVDDPNKYEACVLQKIHRKIKNLLVTKGIVSDGNSSSRV